MLRARRDRLDDSLLTLLGDLPGLVRNLITAVVLVAAMWALLTSLNVEAVGDALRAANPWWMVAAFAVGVLTYLGGGITLADHGLVIRADDVISG